MSLPPQEFVPDPKTEAEFAEAREYVERAHIENYATTAVRSAAVMAYIAGKNAAVEQALAGRAEDAKDAARLNWLLTRCQYNGAGFVSIQLPPPYGDICAAIDNAMQARRSAE